MLRRDPRSLRGCRAAPAAIHLHNGLRLYCCKGPIPEQPRRGSLNDARSTLLLFDTMSSHPELLRQSTSGAESRRLWQPNHTEQEQ